MEDTDDPIVRALERSTIAQTLKAARASLSEPSRPFTPLDRSLFQLQDCAGSSRPTSGYSVDQLHFGLRDSGSLRTDSAHSSRSSKGAGRPDTILEEDSAGYSREGQAEVLRLDGSDAGSRGGGRSGSRSGSRRSGSRRARREVEAAGGDASSSSEELTPMAAVGSSAAPSPPLRAPARPPRPPTGGGYPLPASTGGLGGGGAPCPAAEKSPSHRKTSSASPMRRSASGSSVASASDASPRRRSRSGASPSPTSSPSAFPPDSLDELAQAVLAQLQELAASKEKRRQNQDGFVQLGDRIWTIVEGLQAGRVGAPQQVSAQLLKMVMGFMDLKDTKDARIHFKLSRSALALLRFEGATQGYPASGVQQAYLSIAQGLFKYSQKGQHDNDFLTEGLIDPLLEVVMSASPVCASSDLRVYVTGVLKNVSNDESIQRFLAERDVVGILFGLMCAEQLTGGAKEAQLLTQVTATLRNFSGKYYSQFLQPIRLDALIRVLSVFPSHLELLTNVARILAKLTLHESACEVFAQDGTYVREVARTLSSNADATPLVLRLAFVLGNLTERSDRFRVIFAFDCEGSALVPQLLARYWQKDRQLARVEAGQSTSMNEVEEVLVKLVRLLANIAISPDAGATLASSSAVVDPLLDLLGAKKIGDSEELVLNAVAAVTNLLFYDVPSNLLFQEENKKLLCRLLRPLLLESFNVEALVESARALGNMTRHADARSFMAELRIDEILIILLDHDDRDLVFYVCGTLVNLGGDQDCMARLVRCSPVVKKLIKVLVEAPCDDIALRLVAVKVLTNFSLAPSVSWAAEDVEAVRSVLEGVPADCEEVHPDDEEVGDAEDRQQLMELARQMLLRLPAGDTSLGEVAEQESRCEPCLPAEEAAPGGDDAGEIALWACRQDGCTRRFTSEAKMLAHMERRHAPALAAQA